MEPLRSSWEDAADHETPVAVDQNSLLEEGHRVDELHRSYDGDAQLNESFVVLTIGASLIATLGLLADNAAVVIGAMVVAPWILPLRVAVFAVLVGSGKLLRRSLITLAVGALITTFLAMGLGLIARSNGLLIIGAFPDEIKARLFPTVLDLGIALAAGAIATYAKVNPGAVSSMAGTAIAVALVPPVCVMGLMLAAQNLEYAQGAGLLFAANLLGILIGGICVLAIREPYFREKLRQQRRSRLPLLVALGLATLTGYKLYGRYEKKLYEVKRDYLKEKIETRIKTYLKRETATFGNNDELELSGVNIDWPDYWKKEDYPIMTVVVRVTNPKTPSYKQVVIIQDRINNSLAKQFPERKLEIQMKVQRIHVSVVEGGEVNPSENLDKTLNEAEAAQPSADLMEPIKPEVPEQEQQKPSDETIEGCLKEPCENASAPS